MERSKLLIGNMFYVIRHDTWTVEETDVHSLQDPKFETELEAEEVMLSELWFMFCHASEELASEYDRHYESCKQRIQKLKQQSI